MRTIWKYPLQPGRTDLEIPTGARFLDMQVHGDGDEPCLWFLVDPEAPKEKRVFHMYGTGWELENDTDAAVHYGTFQMGPLVFHVFDVTAIMDPST